MKSDRDAKNLRTVFSGALLAALCATLLLLAGCEALFPPEESDERSNNIYTVTYTTNHGTGSPPSPQAVKAGESVTLANGSGLTRDGYFFSGWNTDVSGAGTLYSAGASYTPATSITLYAMWGLPLPSNLSLAESLRWLAGNAVEGGAYTITVNEDATLDPTTLSYGGKTVSITLVGGAAERTVSLGSSGLLFTLGSGVTLKLGNNITLQGKTSNTAALVKVDNGAALEMNLGSKISGNANTSSYYGGSGGVYVNGGSFTMNGGDISGNSSSSIYSSTTTARTSFYSCYGGGGVYVNDGTFTMNAGKISGNNTTISSYGGGVYVNGGSFTMSGGEISGNSSSSSYGYGGGVYVGLNGVFTKSGGVIYGSNADTTLKNISSGYLYGHAVYVAANKKYDFTVEEEIDLDSTKNGAAGGWVDLVSIPGASLSDSLAWLSANAKEGGAYLITVKANETLNPTTLSYGGKTVSITLEGGTAERIVSLGSDGSLFTVETGTTLNLGSNITLQGKNSNTAALVKVDSGATLEMNTGSKLRDNSSFSSGGGVYVNGGSFFMNGGDLSGNSSSSSGGGVYVASGSFTMNGGDLSNATSTAGGGVYVNDGSFTMNGGDISGANSSTYGGGVYVNGGTFTMSGGDISNANSSTYGGGVYIAGGTFTMSGGDISDATSSYGGGVYVAGGTFTMNGGGISGNTVPNAGGGVYVGNGVFIKELGGVIYGADADSALQNTAKDLNHGHAVYISANAKRDTTVGEDDTLNSAEAGAGGGWVDQSTVSFDAGEGAPSTPDVTVNSGASLGDLMPSDPTRTNYTFGGWYTAQNGGETQFTATTSVTRSITVYALWLPPGYSVHIRLLQPTSGEPSLSNETLSVNDEPLSFSAATVPGTYQWYWDGKLLTGETSPIYTLTPSSVAPNVYTLSVVVTTSTGKLSAECRVDITAY
jgi:uncharacterized repeat protein (TIGR02543 family)